MVWSSLKDGCKTPQVFITKDTRSEEEKLQTLQMDKKKKKRKKKNYHVNCKCEDNHDDEDGNDDDNAFDLGDRALLMHGVESDWVEEEMMDDDVDFIKDVLKQKVCKAFKKASIKKKVYSFLKWSLLPK